MAIEELRTARILLVDVDDERRTHLEKTLDEAGLACTVSTSPHEIEDSHPDVILFDAVDQGELPSAFPTCEDRPIPVIALVDPERGGRTEYFDHEHMPWNVESLQLVDRIKDAVRGHQAFERIEREKANLEIVVRIRTRQLQFARKELFERLALASEFRDDHTGEHTRRVGWLSGKIAAEMELDAEFCEFITSAALLHDIGKIGIPDAILLKPALLTPEERAIMQQHTQIGAAILEGCESPVLQMAHRIAQTHHERWDGHGYPQGLVGKRIPIEGRIVAVADAYDAMLATRPYKKPMLKGNAIKEIFNCSGKQFDPAVVKAFLRVSHRFAI